MIPRISSPQSIIRSPGSLSNPVRSLMPLPLVRSDSHPTEPVSPRPLTSESLLRRGIPSTKIDRIGAVNLSDPEILDRLNIPILPSHYMRHLLLNIKTVTSILEQLHIPYYLSCGCMLGYERNRHLIPWDDDGDICVPEYALPLLNQPSTKELFRHHGLELLEHRLFGFKICPLFDTGEGRYWSETHQRFDQKPFVDIFLVRNNRGRIEYAYNEARLRWPREYIEMPEVPDREQTIFPPLRRERLDSIEVSMLDSPLRRQFLDRAYPNWMSEAVIVSPHTNRPRSPIHVRVQPGTWPTPKY